MPSFWNTRKIAASLNLPTPLKETEILSITTDSRAIAPGSLFIAIQGDTHDGHDYLAQAAEKGAVAVITEKPFTHDKVQVFQVNSTMNAIRTLAHTYRKSFSIPFVGVVGSVGKTTTKELLSSILKGKYSAVHKTEGSLNGFLGIPLTLLAMKHDTQIAIIEIGIDDIGAMEQHLQLVEPTHLILTATGPEHLHQLKTVEIAAAEELKAFDYGKKQQLPLAINLSDAFVLAWFEANKNELAVEKMRTYSLKSDQKPQFSGSYNEKAGILRITHAGVATSYSVPIPGEHHAHNLLAAICMATFFGLTETEILEGLATFKTAYGRTEIYALPNGVEIIGDYYNSNPTSALAAIRLLIQRKGKGKVHAVLGDMLELGDQEETFHRDLAPILIQEKVDYVWLFGPRMKWLQNELSKNGFKASRHFEEHASLVQSIEKLIHADDRILIKGSRGMKMESVLKPLLEKN